MVADGLQPGLVVGNYGRHVLVESADGLRRICHARGKKNEALVGDRVRWKPSGDEGSIESLEPRRNWLYRQDELRTKSFVANVDQVLMMVAARPEPSLRQLYRVLVATQAAGIPTLIACNKKDLQPQFDEAWSKLQPLAALGHELRAWSVAEHPSSAAAGFAPTPHSELLELLQGKATLVMGASGVGKSSLVNRLVHDAAEETAEISEALQSGRHTTTRTTWHWVDADRTTAVIDSPGFQEFGLRHIEPAKLAGLMPDIAALATGCRYYNCLHLHEPGCAVKLALEADSQKKRADSLSQAPTARYDFYSELMAELMDSNR